MTDVDHKVAAEPVVPTPLPPSRKREDEEHPTPLAAVLKFLRSNIVSIASTAALGVATWFYHDLKSDFERYIRSVAYPGIESVSDEQLKDDRFIKATAEINRYVRHIVLPTMSEPNKLDETKIIRNANKVYEAEASKHIRHVLFPDNDKATVDETIIDWFQSKFKPMSKDAGLGSIARVLADNHSVVTDAIVGGIYSGSIRLNQDTPTHRVPVLVPPGHVVRLAYLIEPDATTYIHTRLNYWVIRLLGSNVAAKENPLTASVNAPINITPAFKAEREAAPDRDAALLNNLFYVQIGFNRETLKADLDSLRADLNKKSPKTPIALPDQAFTVVYAIIVESGIPNNITSQRN